RSRAAARGQWHRPAAVPPPVSGTRTVRAADPSLACPGSLNVSKSAAVLDTFPGRVRATDISSLPRAACRVKVRSHARVLTAQWREQQAEARTLDEAIARNLNELGYGCSEGRDESG
ncbi:MAG: hypothetical protein WDA71_05515, partial [Actinomycetota bacterium]